MLRWLYPLWLIILSACSNQPCPKVLKLEGLAMTMPYKILIGESIDQKRLGALLEVIDTTFKEVDQIYNNWNEESEISQFNRAKEGHFLLSQPLRQFLEKVNHIVNLTEGRFDPTIAPLSSMWNQALMSGICPEETLVTILSSSVGWKHLTFKEDHLFKDVATVALDLCAVAKGYCIDLLIDRLKEQQIHNCLVEWAGEIRAIGRHPEGRSWMVNILSDKDSPCIALNDRAVATSGLHLVYKDSKTKALISHIINPLTKAPLLATPSSTMNVTVLAKECYLADALATAALTFSDKEAAKLWAEKIVKEYPEIIFWFSDL